ncbi:unnamed protein product [Haemonchus placei]|uniref:NPH3 domain-containing protein n=1 Tax=Haemonchus placei TaxID=6290 RepID=A0A0N4VYF2_HAEPC|nr:unnamed protein product [Haemonchus placei]
MVPVDFAALLKVSSKYHPLLLRSVKRASLVESPHFGKARRELVSGLPVDPLVVASFEVVRQLQRLQMLASLVPTHRFLLLLRP